MSDSFENKLQQGLMSSTKERSFIDKILAKQDAQEVKNLIKKSNWTREDAIEMLNYMSSNEFKLLNYSEWDRYIMAKFYVWTNSFVKGYEHVFDYEDDLNKWEKPLSETTRTLFSNAKRYTEHNIKFLVNLYFNLARTTLSIDGRGMLELLKSKFEVSYPQGTIQTQQTKNQGGMMPNLRR